jgi:very-short-patch-repair endonuclease
VPQTPDSPDRNISRARELRRDMTDAEKKLWWHLRRLPIEESHFRRQASIGPYFADFASHRYRLVIEVDGSGHGEVAQAAYDIERTMFLKSRGYRVLRFWNNEVLTEIDAVMNAIFAALCHPADSAPPTPGPSPPRASRAGGGEKQEGTGEPPTQC